MTDHRHIIQDIQERPYEGSAWGSDSSWTGEVRAAHGGVTEVQTCICGAQREINLNGRHVEAGSWQAPERRFCGPRDSGQGFYIWVRADGRPVRAARAVETPTGWEQGPSVPLRDVPDGALVALEVTR